MGIMHLYFSSSEEKFFRAEFMTLILTQKPASNICTIFPARLNYEQCLPA